MPFHLSENFHSSAMTPAEEKPEFFAPVSPSEEEPQPAAVEVEEEEYENKHLSRPRQDSFHQSSDNLIVGL
ncbi:hypothetical protein CLIB1423_10S02784 [[Candida] railenensis]|uniref:Uncharacterized protein n=1 Tax=[Candida] railenensis TaxID=45579 RepID=A0A9P0QR20_9ASCO|nr:hypothetical protein CLIB1423_10S02784 [[Candida] railenensis]